MPEVVPARWYFPPSDISGFGRVEPDHTDLPKLVWRFGPPVLVLVVLEAIGVLTTYARVYLRFGFR
jgi:hypothetical protein